MSQSRAEARVHIPPGGAGSVHCRFALFFMPEASTAAHTRLRAGNGHASAGAHNSRRGHQSNTCAYSRRAEVGDMYLPSRASCQQHASPSALPFSPKRPAIRHSSGKLWGAKLLHPQWIATRPKAQPMHRFAAITRQSCESSVELSHRSPLPHSSCLTSALRAQGRRRSFGPQLSGGCRASPIAAVPSASVDWPARSCRGL